MMSYTVPYGGQRLDHIAKQIYGSELDGTTEALLDANPGIAALGPIVPGGTVLTIPQFVPKPANDKYVLAWE